MKKLQLYWRRLLWILFVYLYCGLFFFNFFRQFPHWPFTYIYTMIFVIWLGIEYYEKRLFFQSGFIPYDLLSTTLRVLYALFFYSSFIIGIATIVWWQGIRIDFYPFMSIIGICLFIASVYIRRAAFRATTITPKMFARFYLSIILLSASFAFAYASLFLFGYVIVIGVPLALLQKTQEQHQFARFRNYVHDALHIDTISHKEAAALWQKYLNRKLKKRGKK
jgi:hypothetical protein